MEINIDLDISLPVSANARIHDVGNNALTYLQKSNKFVLTSFIFAPLDHRANNRVERCLFCASAEAVVRERKSRNAELDERIRKLESMQARRAHAEKIIRRYK